jgi:hypothetical protein
MYEFLLSVMVYHKGVVLLAQPEPNIHHTYHTMPGTLYAFEAASGELMWSRSCGGWGKGYRALDPSIVEYRIQGVDLTTGRLRREICTQELFNVGHHHRCYRNRSTERFLTASRRGVEFVDLATGENYQNHWVRSGCLLGNLPANGLLYVTPHPCSCYINAKLIGFNALASQTATAGRKTPSAPRLETGPAYGGAAHRAAFGPNDQWPTYRGAPNGAARAKPASAPIGRLPGRPISAPLRAPRPSPTEKCSCPASTFTPSMLSARRMARRSGATRPVRECPRRPPSTTIWRSSARPTAASTAFVRPQTHRHWDHFSAEGFRHAEFRHDP